MLIHYQRVNSVLKPARGDDFVVKLFGAINVVVVEIQAFGRIQN